MKQGSDLEEKDRGSATRGRGGAERKLGERRRGGGGRGKRGWRSESKEEKE